VIADSLDGARIGITGSTGFLGTALVERLLRSVPGCELVLVVRPGRRATSQRRVDREILRNDAFDRLREQLGDRFDAEMARRVVAVGGDLTRDGLGLDDGGRAALAGCDLVIHSAATVSFDSPLDTSVDVNLLGPNRLLSVLHDTAATPHLVAVSTCYVAGNRRGRAPEQLLVDSPFHVDLDWRAEVAAAQRARADTDAESRSPEMLARFRKEARGDLGAAGLPALSARTEALREKWVEDRLVDAGRARAASLGWPDVYTYTKAMGERALTELRGSIPLSIVRPSIIESAWADPYPGWIRGFRMAEPIIVSYAKGELHQFPGSPEGVIDVIPVDIVASTLVAVAAELAPAEPTVVQVASGTVNPLEYRHLTDTARDWFLANPVHDSDGHPITPKPWVFTGTTGLEERLGRMSRALHFADRTVAALPLRGRQTELNQRLQEKIDLVEQGLGYVKIYGAYGRCEAAYSIDHLDELRQRLAPADRAEFELDPRVVDWTHYIKEIHLPTVVQQARVRMTGGGRRSEPREERLRRQVLDPARHFAAFDLENTLIASNVVESFSWLATRRLSTRDRLRFAARTLLAAPGMLARDSRDRTDFLREFYRRYEGAPAEVLEADAVELASRLLLLKAFPAALRRVRDHRRAGHRTVLITGALDLVVDPLRPLFDDVIAAELRTRDGRFTGELRNVPPTGETRAQVMIEWAESHRLDPAEGVAYADATSDLPMLEAVGFPVAVNPETRLAAIARKRGWLVEHWSKASGGPRPILPMAPLMVERERRRSFR
jgi:alcohol-forming fatty acyl-CoA reductase